MNLYFLVEGRSTEPKVYPRWLATLLPKYRQVRSLDDVADPSYILVSANGYPGILTDHLPNAVDDVNRVGKFDYLLVCLDADAASITEREQEVGAVVSRLRKAQLKVVVQNRCFETWLLGNRQLLQQQVQDQDLGRFLAFFDVSAADPERMGRGLGHSTHGQFHVAYLKAALVARRQRYSKASPGVVGEREYLDQLLSRISDRPGDLRSFKALVEFCKTVAP